jgi:general secretion pathway protein G
MGKLMTPQTRPQSGFTIVELLIVIVVIGILAAITIVAYNGIQSRARETSLRSDLTNIAKQLEMYHVDGDYPANDTELQSIKAKFSFSPVGTNAISCINPSGATAGIALFVRDIASGRQFMYMRGQGVSEVNVSWSSAGTCGTTPYTTYQRWGNGWVIGG